MPVTCSCATCGTGLIRPPSQVTERVFCSRACYHAYPRGQSVLVCSHCAKEYLTYTSRAVRGERFCSRECYDANHAAPLVTKYCPVCQKDYSVKASVADRYMVCSRKCRLASTLYLPCERCGKVFRAYRKQGNHFCSEECRRPAKYILCKTCGKKLRVCPGEPRLYCSLSCYRRYVGETTIETATRHALDCLKLSYIQEGKIGRYSVDFVIPSLNIALEVDGAYWHRNKLRDARKNSYLALKGWFVMRVNEVEITARETSETLAEYLSVRMKE